MAGPLGHLSRGLLRRGGDLDVVEGIIPARAGGGGDRQGNYSNMNAGSSPLASSVPAAGAARGVPRLCLRRERRHAGGEAGPCHVTRETGPDRLRDTPATPTRRPRRIRTVVRENGSMTRPSGGLAGDPRSAMRTRMTGVREWRDRAE